MCDLEFKFEECIEEVQMLKAIAKDFLASGAEGVLDALRNDLKTIRTREAGLHRWEIASNRPLMTKPSQGQYEIGGGGSHRAVGEVTGIWKISPVRRPGAKKGSVDVFRVEGNASVKLRVLRVLDDTAPKELAMWRMELGAADSPGCFFHTQIMGEGNEPPFPHSLSVPRLPAILFTPMAAFEFIISELFQEEWRRHASWESPEMQRWKSIQRKRLDRLFAWQREVVTTCVGSPWNALKGRKPHACLFTETDKDFDKSTRSLR